MIKWIVISIVAFCILTAFAFFVWPTRYRYDHTNFFGKSVVVRMDRLSGTTEILLDDKGWVRPETLDEETKVPTEVDIPNADLSKITGRLGIGLILMEGSIYNGSDWIITEMTFEISAEDTTRKYRYACNSKPMSADSVTLRIDDDMAIKCRSGKEKLNYTWRIASAKGHRPDK